MTITREQAFGVFEDLLAAGLRPHVSGFRADGSSAYWPKGQEGFFVSATVETTRHLGSTINDMQAMETIATAHGLTAWFSGQSEDMGDEIYRGIIVKFETPSPAAATHERI